MAIIHGMIAISALPLQKTTVKEGIEILVVDDDQPVREALKAMLECSGHTVQAVECGEAALAFLAQRKFDIVLTDLCMPGMRGDQLVSRIRQQLPRQRIIMVTAFIEDNAVLGGKPSDSVNAVLFKPFSFDELNQIINRVLTEQAIFMDNMPPGRYQGTVPFRPDRSC